MKYLTEIEVKKFWEERGQVRKRLDIKRNNASPVEKARITTELQESMELLDNAKIYTR